MNEKLNIREEKNLIPNKTCTVDFRHLKKEKRLLLIKIVHVVFWVEEVQERSDV